MALTMFAKSSILDVWQGSKYASAHTQNHSDIVEAICIKCKTSLCWALEDTVTFKYIVVNTGWRGNLHNLAKGG